jgi:dethiobiotin synthetase
MPGIYVTGTGTGIGKTYVAAHLIRQLRGRRHTVRAYKPVVTGYTEQTMGSSDSALLLQALAEPISTKTIDAVSPWRYRAALGPIGAAALEGRRIDFTAIAAFTAHVLRQAVAAEFTIVEGLGGVMVPFDEQHTLLDLIALAAVPAVVVTGSYLGSLSHSLTALEVLCARGIRLAAVVVNESCASTVSLEQTVFALTPFVQRMGSPLVRLPRDPAKGDLDAMCETILAGLRG